MRCAAVIAVCVAAVCFSFSSAAAQPEIAGRLDRYSRVPDTVFALPKGLKEISGLAAAGHNAVYAHNDEHGIMYKIDIETGDILKAFALGEPTVRGDFEGVAEDRDRLYVITSTGQLHEALIGRHRTRVLFNVYDTGLAKKCEVEGLANGSKPGSFMIVCKHAPITDERRLHIYEWSLEDRNEPAASRLDIPLSQILEPDEREDFRPSAIEFDEATQTIIVVSARNGVMIELSSEGEVLSKRRLPLSDHPQTEGVAILPSGTLVLSDEGQRRGPGKLSVFEPFAQ